jgi:hypothetical protein
MPRKLAMVPPPAAMTAKRVKFKEILERRASNLATSLDYLRQLGQTRGRPEYDCRHEDVLGLIEFVETEVERCLEVWRKDPTAPRFQLKD